MMQFLDLGYFDRFNTRGHNVPPPPDQPRNSQTLVRLGLRVSRTVGQRGSPKMKQNTIFKAPLIGMLLRNFIFSFINCMSALHIKCFL